MRQDNLPALSNYGEYSSNNYGAHCMCVDLPRSRKNKHGMTLYFSYDTCVAFRGYINENEYGLFVCKNVWGTTTGKHLNWIDGGSEKRRKERLSEKEFEKKFRLALKNA